MKEEVKKLWEAANVHSMVTLGEWLDPDYEGDSVPPMAEEESAVIKEVTGYLLSTC